MTQLEKARKDFDKLTAPVNDDPMAQTQVADLVSAAVFELDLQEEGEQVPELTKPQINALKRFVAKWSGK